MRRASWGHGVCVLCERWDDMRHEMILNFILDGWLAKPRSHWNEYGMTWHMTHDMTTWHEMVVSIWMAYSYIGWAKEEKWHDIHDYTVLYVPCEKDLSSNSFIVLDCCYSLPTFNYLACHDWLIDRTRSGLRSCPWAQTHSLLPEFTVYYSLVYLFRVKWNCARVSVRLCV